MRPLREEEKELSNTPSLPSPRRSVQTRVLLAMMAMVTIPTCLCGYLTHARAAEAFEQNLMRDSAVLAQTASHLIEGYVEAGRTRDLSVALDQVIQDKRIAFMVIWDSQGRMIDQRYNEPLAWHGYQQQLTPQERLSPLTLNRSIRLAYNNGDEMVVRRQLIRQQAAVAPTVPGATTYQGSIIGCLELGLVDPQQDELVNDMRDATLLIMAVISLLSMPLVVWLVRGLTRPLRRMLAATMRLGADGTFEPLEIKRDDEIGMLARSFNTMARNLANIRQALVDANEHLEQKVTERTGQLEHAKAQLEQEMVEKDQFIRAISHDLGAPLRNIAGLTSMLMLKHRAQMEEEVLSKLERISANIKTENDLIADLLELSRIKTRNGRRQNVDLAELVQSIAGGLSFDLEERKIEFVIDTPLPVLHAERNRMRQVFQNLIDNAIKYMPADQPLKRISVGVEKVNGVEAMYVRDTGMGIAPADQQAIFVLFRRARYSGHNDAPGRGVGLATVKTIIERYGGRIWVASEPPHGSTFYFTIDPQHYRAAVRGAARPVMQPQEAAS